MTPQSLELAGIGKRFGADEVLKGIDLSIRAGEFLSLVGMSGCGKSTLLRIISGLETPDRGTLSIGGENVTGRDPSDRNLAMVFQSQIGFAARRAHLFCAQGGRLAVRPRERVAA